MDRNTNAVGVGTTVSVTESLTQIEIEIVNKIGIHTSPECKISVFSTIMTKKRRK